jgi:hypothetical protein
MALVFDVCMFIFMVAIIFAQYYTIIKFDERIKNLTKEVGARQISGKSQRGVMNQRLRKVERDTRRRPRSKNKQPTYMRGELQLHREGQVAFCDATFKPTEIR